MSNNQRPSLDLTASCACGDVKVSLSGKPITMLLCSCRDCQMATGTGHAALAVMRKSDVVLEGETRGFDKTANSGNRITRNFCPSCGTPIIGESTHFPELRMLPVGLFGDTPWFAPGAVIFHRTHNHWDVLPENIPAYETYKEG